MQQEKCLCGNFSPCSKRTRYVARTSRSGLRPLRFVLFQFAIERGFSNAQQARSGQFVTGGFPGGPKDGAAPLRLPPPPFIPGGRVFHGRGLQDRPQISPTQPAATPNLPAPLYTTFLP